MSLIPHGIFGAIIVLVIGFWIGKKYPNLFASIPVVNAVL